MQRLDQPLAGASSIEPAAEDLLIAGVAPDGSVRFLGLERIRRLIVGEGVVA